MCQIREGVHVPFFSSAYTAVLGTYSKNTRGCRRCREVLRVRLWLLCPLRCRLHPRYGYHRYFRHRLGRRYGLCCNFDCVHFPRPGHHRGDNSIRWQLKPDPRRYLFPCETTRIRAFRTDLVSPLECLRESRFSFKSSIATSESRTLSRGRCEFRADKRIGVTRPRSVTWHNFPLKTFHPQQGVNWTFLTGRPECVYFI